MAKNKLITESEHIEQRNLFLWAKDCVNLNIYPELEMMFAIPNVSYGGGKANLIRGAKLKAEGRKSGVPDIFLPVARRSYNGLFIEMKASDGRVSDNQKDWINKLQGQGYLAEVCIGCQQAEELIEWYLNEDR